MDQPDDSQTQPGSPSEGLAKALMDAAAAVLPAAYDESCGATVLSPSTSPEDWALEARAAVVAVLETLAADYEGDDTMYVSTVDLRQLATEVRDGGVQ